MDSLLHGVLPDGNRGKALRGM
eukprot:COSAG02_NODE_57702_length_279_cov_2.261111_1_plen_21_part_01